MFQEELKKPKKPEQQGPHTEEPFRWNKFQANYDAKHKAKAHSVSGGL